LSSKKDPFDPMEKALRELGSAALYNTEHLHNWPLLKSILSRGKSWLFSHVWIHLMSQVFGVSAKEAPKQFARSLSS